MTDRFEANPLTAADSAWLRMEDATNLMTITSVMTLAERLPRDEFLGRIEDTLLPHERFRMCVRDPAGKLGKPAWIETDFDLSKHVLDTRLEDRTSKAELQTLVSSEMSTPLAFDRPLWRFRYVEDFRGGSALVARIHHCIGDGMSLMQVLLGMTDPAETEDGIAQVGLAQAGDDHESIPSARRIVAAVKAGGHAAGALARLLSMRADPATAFKGPLGVDKLAVWSNEIPLATVKDIGRRLEATINDVLTAAVTETLRSYLEKRAQGLPVRDLRAVIPVNLRPPSDTELGNQFGLVYLSLPVGVGKRIARVRAVKERMDRLKRSPEAFVVYAVLRALGSTHAGLHRRVVNLLSKNATAVMTNVPGPRRPLAICGRAVDDMMFWVPQSGRLGLGVSILSYDGRVRLGLAVDRGLIPDPGELIAGFESALSSLAGEAGTSL